MVLKRLRVLVWMFATLFLCVEARLWHLQFVERDFWELEGRKARLEGRAVAFRRGALLDRNGRVLAEGRQVHDLTFTYWTFRRETAIGQLLGGMRTLFEHERVGDVTRLSDVLSDPLLPARSLLGLSDRAIESLPGRIQGDLRYYARRLLGLEENEFRRLRGQSDPERPWLAFDRAVLDRIADRVRYEVECIQELAFSCGSDPGGLLLEIERRIGSIEAAYARAVAFNPRDLTLGQRRALRRDYERREQTLIRAIPYRSVFLIERIPERFPGFAVRQVDARWYPEAVANLCPTLIGWTGFPTDTVLAETDAHRLRFQELRARDPETLLDEEVVEYDDLRESLRYRDYLADEEMGRWGLEALLEPVLRGQRGWRVVEQDRGQNARRLLEYRAPVDGRDVTLTLDAGLQLACERVLERSGRPGSIVLLDPKDGAIRAMATWPEPTRDDVRKRFGELIRDPTHPLSHRAYAPQGDMPPPGSVFKTVVAAAAVESGAIDRDTAVECERWFSYGGRRYKCLGHHGSIDVVRALEKSCNVFFYRVALRTGVEPILDLARRFGVGDPSGFGDKDRLGLPEPAVSILDLARLAEGRGGGFAIQTSIGHGAVEDCTTLQMATFLSPFANGGYRVRPYLVDRIGDSEAPRSPPSRVGLSARALDLVREGMRRVTESGTARPEKAGLDLAALGIAGKTGTPQTARGQHAAFGGFFPFSDPRLVFALLLEDVDDDEGGGGVCAPVLADLVRQPELEPFLQRSLR